MGDAGDAARIYWTILESSLNTFAVHIAYERNIFIVENYVVICPDANIEMPIEYRDATAYVIEDVCNLDERCWRGNLSLKVHRELEWLCTIHHVNWYEENIFYVVNLYLRDRGGVTGDNEVIFTVSGHPRVPGVCQLRPLKSRFNLQIQLNREARFRQCTRLSVGDPVFSRVTSQESHKERPR